MDIYEQLTHERLFTPESPTGPLPVISAAGPLPLLPVAQEPTQPAGPGAFDELVRPTWNGLRYEDLVYPQPPQDPAWRPDAHG